MLKFLGKKGRTLVILILLSALLGIILFLNKILFPFLLASFLASVLAPVIETLQTREVPKRRLLGVHMIDAVSYTHQTLPTTPYV